ncbi:hypothetical protein F5Y10DRAFT_252738 [Nemania abortiva]|nr:hypothetical protein F5Y10DRAFT_252738 [Nemania abortiva]
MAMLQARQASSQLADFASLSPEMQAAILAGPSLPPPPGVQPNFDNPPNSNQACLIVVSIFLVIVVTAMSLRIYARIRNLHLSDWFAFGSLAVFIAWAYFLYSLAHFPGLFVHQWDIRLGQLKDFLYPAFIVSILYGTSLALIKTAIIVEWLRIFNPNGTRNMFFWTCHITMWVNIAFLVTAIVLINTAFTPREGIWDVTIPAVKHVNTRASNLFSSVFNLIVDLAILCLPQRIIWTLRMPRSRKIGVSIIFATGVIACGTAIARLAVTVDHLTNPDATYSFATLGLISLGEGVCAFLVFCIPALPKAVGSLYPKSLGLALRSWASSSLHWLRRPSATGDASRSDSQEKPVGAYIQMDNPNRMSLTQFESAGSSAAPLGRNKK